MTRHFLRFVVSRYMHEYTTYPGLEFTAAIVGEDQPLGLFYGVTDIESCVACSYIMSADLLR